MVYLLGVMNLYQKSIISCFVIMTIVGLALIIEDKKRWIAHTKRSADIINRKAKAEIDTDSESEEIEEGQEKKKKGKNKDKEYEYVGRISDKVLGTIAFLFGALGELLGMIFVKHKWHRSYYKFGMPILAFLEVIFVFFIIFILGELGGDGAIHVT